VSCASATACTAVGGVLDSSGNNSLGTVAEQWNGTGWVLRPSPGSKGLNYFLNAVSCTSPSACTAVGNTASQLLAERWNGTTWTVQPVVTPAGTAGNGDYLSGISCSSSSDCTAVGLAFTPSGPLTVAELWDGTSWTLQPTPLLPGAQDIKPPAVSCPNRITCTAVGGDEHDGPGSVTLAEQWRAPTPGIQPAAPHAAGTGALGLACIRSLAPLRFGPGPTAATPPPVARALISSRPGRVSLARMLRSCRGV
jgi:hypothetical protein